MDQLNGNRATGPDSYPSTPRSSLFIPSFSVCLASPASRRPGEIAEEAKETFEQALSKIRPATEKVITTLRGLAHKPEEIEIEFGFSLNAAVGVVIAAASTAANYKVTLRWKQEEQKSNS